MSISAPECPLSPTQCHDRYSNGTCAYCRTGPSSSPRTSEITRAFAQGESLAYARVLAYLEALPYQEATKGRDHGRGVTYGVTEIRNAVRSLAEDSGVDL